MPFILIKESLCLCGVCVCLYVCLFVRYVCIYRPVLPDERYLKKNRMLLLFLQNNIPLINDVLNKVNIIIKTYSGIIKETTQLAIMIYVYTFCCLPSLRPERVQM